MGTSLDALNEPLRSAVKGMIREAGPGKITWTSTRRTRAEQAALRIKNGCPDVDKAPASACRVPTARPGESNHESGDAIDFTNTDAVIHEVERLANKYGIHRTVPGERWHYEHKSRSKRASDAPLGPVDGKGVGIGDLPGLAGGIIGGIDVPGADALGSIVAALTAIGDPRVWLRALEILAGGALVVAGVVLLAKELAPTKVVTDLAVKAVAGKAAAASQARNPIGKAQP